MRETSLLERARRGDRAAFRTLVETHEGRLRRLAVGILRDDSDADDVLQEVFLKAYRTLDRFRGDAALQSWLYRITVNQCLDLERHRRVRGAGRAIALDGADGPVLIDRRSAADPERRAQSSRIREDVTRAVGRLTPLERSVFVLRHDVELPVKEVARALECSEGTVKSMLFRAVRKLRRELAFYREPGAGEVTS